MPLRSVYSVVMENLIIAPDQIEFSVVNTAKDGSPLAYRLITADPVLRERLLPLLAEKADVAFEIGSNRFHGKIQTEDRDNESEIQQQSLAFIVNLLLGDEETARISEGRLQGVGTGDCHPNEPSESTIPWNKRS